MRTIYRTRVFIALAALGITAAGLTPHPARAQFTVFDPANFSQNVLTAIRTLQSNLHEVTQIANQITQITNQIQNLQHMNGAVSAGLLASYIADWQHLTQAFLQINGLASNIATLTARYNALFPQRSGGLVSSVQVLAQVQQYLAQARQTYSGVYRTSGTVMAALPQSQADVAAALASSTGAQGNLDALQAQTQVMAQVARLLVQENAQLATLAQAQADSFNQEMQWIDTAAAQAQQNAILTFSSQPPAAYLPPLH